MENNGIKIRVWKHLLKVSKKSSRKGLYEFLEIQSKGFPDNISVLNVGAGGEIEALIRPIAEAKSWVFHSLDNDESRNPEFLGSIESFNHRGDSFDVIFIMEVLEHLQEPQMALDNLFRMLKPSGCLVASSPFLLPIHDGPNDYYRYTEFGLKHLFSKFENVSVVPRNGYFEAINIQIMRILVSSRGKSLLPMLIAGLSIYFIKYIAQMLDRLIYLDIGTTGYKILAIKPDSIGRLN